MTPRQRIEATLEGRSPDRLPITFWRHFFREERTAEGLAEAMSTFQQTFGWDLVKVNPGTYYCAESWGALLAWPKGADEAPVLAEPAVSSPRDWERLPRLGAGDGLFGPHLEALSLIRKSLGAEVPSLMTVFSPLSVAGQLAGGDEQLKAHLAQSPAAVQKALETITETLAEYALEALKLGADGIFFPTTHWATRTNMTVEQYRRLAQPWDLAFLRAVRGRAKILMLHVCRDENMVNMLLDYPVDIFNWDSHGTGNPSIGEVRERTEKTLLGGISSCALLAPTPHMAWEQARRARAESGGSRFILGAGCVIPPGTPAENLRALKEWAQAPANTMR